LARILIAWIATCAPSIVTRTTALKRVPCPVRPDDEPTVWILSSVLGSKRIVNGVADVFVVDAVLASRRVDLHDA
jgi:hypothetical protein